MTCRVPVECGNCGRHFYQYWKLDKHVCKENLSVRDRLREWRTFRNTTETEKFLAVLRRNDPELAAQVATVYKAWNDAQELVL